MRTLLAVAFVGMLSVGFGCQDKKHHDHKMSGDKPNMMSNDACSHCPGVQTLDASGKCPACNMKVSK